MSATHTERLLRRMFLARRLTIRAGLALLALMFTLFCDATFHLLTDRGQAALWIATGVDLAAIAAVSLATGYYVFRVGLREKDPAYAVGHAALCVLFLLVGAIVVPLLVREDIRRREGADGESAGGRGSPMPEGSQSMPEPDEDSRPDARRPWQFSLRTLLLLTTVAALLISAAVVSPSLVTAAMAVVALSFAAAVIGALAMRG